MNQVMILILILVGVNWSSHAVAQDADYKTLGINLMYRQYSFNQSETDPIPLTPMTELELAIRIYKIYHFSVLGMNALDKKRYGYGAGLRVNLPGFFFLGAKPQDMTRESKKYPLNCSIYGTAIRTTIEKDDNSIESTMIAQYGGTLDIFLFNKKTYLTTDIAIHTLKGDSTWIYGVGLGFQF